MITNKPLSNQERIMFLHRMRAKMDQHVVVSPYTACVAVERYEATVQLLEKQLVALRAVLCGWKGE